ncbi:hypothetical protein ACVIJU_003058 [Aeribacillus sp. SP014]
MAIVEELLRYQYENRRLARFVHREVTLDSTLIRQVMMTYLAKEKYYLLNLFERGMRSNQFKQVDIPHFLVQFKSLINMPFLQPQYMYEVLHINPYEEYFVKQYSKQLVSWLEQILFQKNEKQSND